MATTTSSLEVLHAVFPGRVALNFEELARAIDLSKEYIENTAAKGRFPIRSVKINGRRVFPIAAVAAYLDQGAPRRGRPTKAEQIARGTARVAAEVRP